jgi:1-acyl-sn-glycerol-3-phosphate acyltransferase
MLQKIRAVLTAIFFISTICCTIIIMFLFKKKNRNIRRIWANLQRFIVHFKINTKGYVNENAKLLIINHQSILDIVALEAIFNKAQDIAWIAKKEIFDLFFLGQSVKISKMIPVDRGDKRAMVKLLKDVKDRINSGRIVAIFPEGTRGKGDKLLKFKSGAKIIAEKLELIVQPIVIANTRHVLDSQNFQVNSGEIFVSFLPVINPKENENWYENMHMAMQKELSNLLEKIEQK